MFGEGWEKRESITAQRASPTPKYRSGLWKSLTSCTHKITNSKRQCSQAGTLWHEPSLVLLGEKPFSVTLLLVFLTSMRVHICFPSSQAESSSAPAPCCPDCPAEGEEDLGSSNSKTSAQLHGPSTAPAFTDVMPNNPCPTPPGEGRANTRVQGADPSSTSMGQLWVGQTCPSSVRAAHPSLSPPLAPGRLHRLGGTWSHEGFQEMVPYSTRCQCSLSLCSGGRVSKLLVGISAHCSSPR